MIEVRQLLLADFFLVEKGGDEEVTGDDFQYGRRNKGIQRAIPTSRGATYEDHFSVYHVYSVTADTVSATADNAVLTASIRPSNRVNYGKKKTQIFVVHGTRASHGPVHEDSLVYRKPT